MRLWVGFHMQRIFFMVLLGLLPLSVVADGKVFPPVAFPAGVRIPDQRALIHFTNGVERLVIETRFTGAGTNFAWVVPLPSQPVVEAASTGLFPTLQYLFRPTVTHNVPKYYVLILAAIAIGLLLRWIVHLGVSLLSVLMVVLLLFLLAALLLPALGPAASKSAGMSGATDPSLSILDRQLVGVFETTTIASREPEALQSWLRANGFTVTTNSDPVIADYVKDGWVFVAAKIRRDLATEQTSTPHPLSFTFKTERPVYPMRLTGVDSGPLQVELYVFGEQRAHARHFNVERCTKPTYQDAPGGYWYKSPETPNISHPLLRKWVDGSGVATKLTATLSPNQMRRDVWLDWRGFWETKHHKFSHAGAATFALNWAAGILVLGLVVAYAVAVSARPAKPRLSKPLLLAVAVSLAIGGLIYFMLPKIAVRLEKRPWAATHNAQYYPLFVVEGESLEAARRILTDPVKAVGGEKTWERISKNGYLGGNIHEEDSPGNFILREKDGYIEYVIFDAQGAESVVRAWQAKPDK